MGLVCTALLRNTALKELPQAEEYFPYHDFVARQYDRAGWNLSLLVAAPLGLLAGLGAGHNMRSASSARHQFGLRSLFGVMAVAALAAWAASIF